MPNLDSLFPELAEDLTALSDEDLESALAEHLEAIKLINADDKEFLGDLAAEDVIAQMRAGADAVIAIRGEKAARAEAHETYEAQKAEISAELEIVAEKPENDDPVDDAPQEDEAEDGDEEAGDDEEEEESPSAAVEDKELVLASGEEKAEEETSTEVVAPVRMRRNPAPAPDRVVVVAEEKGATLVAAGELSYLYKEPLNPDSLAEVIIASASHHGPHPKVDAPGKYRFGGPEHKVAHADFEFPEDRILTSDIDTNVEKIRASIVETAPGGYGAYSLTASGGLCAPLEPIYTMPNFATDAEPVWDALPTFQAQRGGVNVPDATTIGDITTAISSISEANDALGGTFATKSCQDLSCPNYTEVAVQILAHCREYGNLNARAWPEKIRHENELTMAALARTSETFILERIKALSVNVTSGAATLSGLSYLVDAIAKSQFGIRGRLRMPRSSRFRVLLPAVILDMLLVDTIQTIDGNRFRSREQLDEYLRSTGVDPVYYLDGDFAAGDDMIPDASQGAGALDSWPNTFQWALYPEGTFLGIDMGTLELGIVRDSTLNSTNDFQVFGERFRNVARIGPAQAAYWETTTLCAVGQFPPAGTARTCES